MNNNALRIKRLYEVGKIKTIGLEIYPNGTAHVIRAGGEFGDRQERGEVKTYSRKSRERFAFVSRETLVEFHSMITLSYGKQFPLDGRAVKKHLNRFLTWYRRCVGGEYIWWLEFQSRGAPHVHIASQKERVRPIDREIMADQWAKAQGLTYGLYYSDIETRIERNLYDDVFSVHKFRKQWSNSKKPDGPKRYILKYALKPRQKTVPPRYRNVGRFYGYSREVRKSIPPPSMVHMGEAEIRDRLQADGHSAHSWQYLPTTLFGVKANMGEAD